MVVLKRETTGTGEKLRVEGYTFDLELVDDGMVGGSSSKWVGGRRQIL